LKTKERASSKIPLLCSPQAAATSKPMGSDQNALSRRSLAVAVCILLGGEKCARLKSQQLIGGWLFQWLFRSSLIPPPDKGKLIFFVFHDNYDTTR